MVYMQAEHTCAKRGRKSPVLTSSDMYSSEGKPQIYLLLFVVFYGFVFDSLKKSVINSSVFNLVLLGMKGYLPFIAIISC